MRTEGAQEISILLAAWSDGDQEALKNLVPMVYPELRRIARVELRYFGGLTVEETAEILGISADTVLRDWKMAKVWLLRELERS